MDVFDGDTAPFRAGLRESAASACSSILSHLSLKAGDRLLTPIFGSSTNEEEMATVLVSRRAMLIADLRDKKRHLAAGALLTLLARTFTPQDILEVAEMGVEPDEREGWLVLVTTPNELRAARAALMISNERPITVNEYPTWDLSQTHLQLPSRVILAMTGEKGPIVTMNACNYLLDHFRVRAAILCGTAAGVADKANLGDVLCARVVTDTTPERREAGQALPRPDYARIPDDKWRRLALFMSDTRIHWSGLGAALSQLSGDDRPAALEQFSRPSVHPCTILSRPLLIADGSLPSTLLTVSEEVRGAEMEALGFAKACEGKKVDWWVFKGVSDFGDPTSKDGLGGDRNERKKWQFPATVASVVFAMAFIRGSTMASCP